MKLSNVLTFVFLLPAALQAESNIPSARIVDQSEVAISAIIARSGEKLNLKIEGATTVNSKMWVEVVQLATQIAAPLARVAVHDLSNVCKQEKVFELNLPNVDRESNFLIRVISKDESNADSKLVSSRQLKIYPPDVLAALSKWSERHQLRIENFKFSEREEMQKLEQVFRDSKISFSVTAANKIKKDSVTIVFGAWDQREFEEYLVDKSGSFIFVDQAAKELPFVWVKDLKGLRVVKMPLEALAALEKDPKMQQQFIEIFKLALPEANDEESWFEGNI